MQEESSKEGVVCPSCQKLRKFATLNATFVNREFKCGCGNVFYATSEVHVMFTSTPDCKLNGLDCSYKRISETHLKCVDCGKDSIKGMDIKFEDLNKSLNLSKKADNPKSKDKKD